MPPIEHQDENSTRIAVLVSGQGRGTNLSAILAACFEGVIPGKLALVIGTRAESPALERASFAGVPIAIVSPKKHDEAEYTATLQHLLEQHKVNLICLAGYMRRLSPQIVSAYRNRIMNVHPALLPLFGGQGMYGHHVHEAVLASGMKVSGCTVHFVDEEYDTGPIIAQTAVPVLNDDTPETLAARVLSAETQTYVQAVQWYAEGRLRIVGRRVVTVPYPNELYQE